MSQPKSDGHDILFSDFFNDLVARFDPQLRHTFVNASVELFTGRSASEFLGKTNQELGMPEDLVALWDEALHYVFRTGEPREIRFVFDGPARRLHFHSRLIPEKETGGKVGSVLSIAREVTWDANAELRGEFDASRYQAILENSDDAIVGKTLDGIVTSWNAAAEAMFGYTAEEMLGQTITCLFPPDRLEEEEFIIERLRNGERIDHFETVRVHKSGRPIHVSVTTSPIRDAAGNIIGASKIARDITPLMLERARLQLVLEATGNGLWDWDVASGKVYRSDHYLSIVGYTPDDDTHDFDFFQRTVHPQDLQRVLQNIADYREGRTQRIEFEYRLVTKTGPTNRWVQIRGQAVERDIHGGPTRIVGTLTDVTEAKLAYSELQDREKRLMRVLEGSEQGYWDWNIQTNSLTVSPRWADMLGYTLEEMDVSNGRFEAYVHPEDFAGVMQMARQHVDGRARNLNAEIRCRTKSGEWKWILTRGRVVEWDEAGNPLMVSGTHTDIMERKLLELSQKDAATVFDNSYEGIMVVNAEGLITRINPAFTRTTGYTSDEILGKSPKVLSSGRHDRAYYEEMYRTLAEKRVWTGEIWNRRKNGEIYPQLLSISAVVDNRNVVQHYIGISADISKLKAHEEELDRVAHYDPLTGTPNRRLLTDRMQQAIIRADRHQTTLGVCYIDLDGFKEINDQHGHSVGDALLKSVTENLKQVLRSDDTLSRLGGDEFVLLLSDMETPEECAQIMERVLAAIRLPITIESAILSVTGSVGVSLYPNDHSDADTLLRHADQAMYRAKEAGKNGFHMFDPDSDLKVQQHRKLVARMHDALRDGEFKLYFQPKVNLRNGDIVGMEALIRWHHPEKGLLSPAVFLPHVDGSTLDQPLGNWVINRALDQAAQWLELGNPMKVSVNVGAHHLLHPGFLDDLRKSLQRHPALPADLLELEVLESVAISDMTQTVTVLSECRRMGVKLALDDFGTGYSSLTYLRKLPVDTLKIDQSFVRDMLTDPEDLGIVEAVIRLANAFNREVIAEGVETLAHGRELLQMGCQLAQGYGISRPMPEQDVMRWAQEWMSRRAWLDLSPMP